MFSEYCDSQSIYDHKPHDTKLPKKSNDDTFPSIQIQLMGSLNSWIPLPFLLATTRVITFTFMHLTDGFIQSDLAIIQVIIFFVSMCVPWKSNPQPLRCWRNALPQTHWPLTSFMWEVFEVNHFVHVKKAQMKSFVYSLPVWRWCIKITVLYCVNCISKFVNLCVWSKLHLIFSKFKIVRHRCFTL